MKETQCMKVLRYLREFGSITAAEAMEHFGCFRLAARIADLRDEGIAIESEIRAGKNRFGDTIYFAVYTLKEDNV